MLRHISVTKDVTFIILSQLNREGQKKAEKDKTRGSYSLNNLSEANNLERYAYYVMTMYMDDELKMAGQVLISLLKHRDGQTLTEPFKTFVKHQHFIVGDLGFGFSAPTLSGSEEIKSIESSDGKFSDDEFLDIFGIK
jgi:hypothetical protein